MNELSRLLQKHRDEFHQVVDFSTVTDKICKLDLSSNNPLLARAGILESQHLSSYIQTQLNQSRSKYGIGGYAENRTIYNVDHFSKGKEQRTLHLGIDIWGPEGTEVFVPIGGMVHSFAFNDHLGDYGATIILQHQLETIVFHTLYGHVSLSDLAKLHEGQYLNRGEIIAHIGDLNENGNWPPHLHFQVIGDMYLKKGDFPGVCAISDQEKYLSNCPNPDFILNMMEYS
jgi:murein DD-endopeptidase MepM/ murein hydrolase activator NlpD